MTREQQNNQSLLHGSDPAEIAGLSIRPMSLTTLSMMEAVGNPLASAVAAKEGEAPVGMNLEHLLEVVYIHAGPKDEVRRLTRNYALMPEAFADAVLDFGERLTPEDLKAIMQHLRSEQDAIAAAGAEPVASSGDSSKN